MGWWEATVRVRVGASFGSGVLIAPQVVLTAAHNVSGDPGQPLAAPDQILVTPMFGNVTRLTVHRVRATAEWLSDAPDANLQDLAVLAVDVGGPTHLLPAFAYGAIGSPFDGGAYGFVGDQAVQGRFLRGKLVSDGTAYTSSTITPEAGMSGGPMLADTVDGPAESFVLAGITRSRPSALNGTANLGLVLRADVLNRLLTSLSSP